MSKKYELVLILDPQMGDTQLEAADEKYKSQLESAGGTVVNVDKWGQRKMAYTSMALRQRQQGFYLMYQFEGPSQVLETLEPQLKLDDAVMRYLFVTVSGEFLRVPTLAPENVYIYHPPERPRDRRGPRRDRDDRGPRRDDARDGSRGERSDSPSEGRGDSAATEDRAPAAAGGNGEADSSDS